MALFYKTPADLKLRAELDFRKSERKLASVREAARKADAELQKNAEEQDYNRAHNIEKVLRGEATVQRVFENLGLYQDRANACTAALKIAEEEHAQAVHTLREAEHVDRCARRDDLLRELVAELTAGILAKGDALAAIYAEDPGRQTLVDFPQLADQIRSWLVAVETHLNPPPPPKLDPSMTRVRFIKSTSGFGMEGHRRSISAFSAGETAAFGAKEAAFLIERGFVVEVKPDAPEDEAA